MQEYQSVHMGGTDRSINEISCNKVKTGSAMLEIKEGNKVWDILSTFAFNATSYFVWDAAKMLPFQEFS